MLEVDPVRMVMSPESSLRLTPAAVSTVTAPVAATSDAPPVMVTTPPALSLDAPAVTTTSLPAPDVLFPTDMEIAPPRF